MVIAAVAYYDNVVPVVQQREHGGGDQLHDRSNGSGTVRSRQRRLKMLSLMTVGEDAYYAREL